jgi:hypothetical protein
MSSVSDPDSMGLWFRIQEGKNDPPKKAKSYEIMCRSAKSLDVLYKRLEASPEALIQA